MRVIVPQPLDLLRVGRPVRDDEPVPGDVRLARLDAPVAPLGRAEAEERLVGVEPHALREAEVFGVAKEGDAGRLAVDLAADPAPLARRLVAVAAVLAFAGEEDAVALVL